MLKYNLRWLFDLDKLLILRLLRLLEVFWFFIEIYTYIIVFYFVIVIKFIYILVYFTTLITIFVCQSVSCIIFNSWNKVFIIFLIIPPIFFIN